MEIYNTKSELLRPFKIIAFDWDGTAVVDRHSEAKEIIGVIDEFLKLGIYIVIITGTNFDNIDRQFSAYISGEQKSNLFVCTNRGSEVYGFDNCSNKILEYKRVASAKENELLDSVVVKAKNAIEETSKADIKIIFDRLNRRKLDLLPEWEAPKKSEIDLLLKRTNENLEKCGFAGGIHKAFQLVKNLAKSSGLKDARITSDVKHLEVGLTDKSDSVKWLIDNIVRKNRIDNSEILIGGDEFGKIGGFHGSDYNMFLGDEVGITYFSVGIEPNGVPEPIIYLGGGPESFLALMKNIYVLSKPKLLSLNKYTRSKNEFGFL